VFESIDHWAEVMDSISESAYQKYRKLVERDEFLAYFHTASPIDQIGQLNIGSRPAHRRATETLDDLRAIPWVFAWTQTRTNVPSWYGVGTGIETWLADDTSERLQVLIEMYQQWPFFRTLMSNVQLGMGRADMAISELYAQLAEPEIGAMIFEDIRDEFKLTQNHVLHITGGDELLQEEPWLNRSIRMRNPYVDPMNYIQVELLKKLRANPEGPESDAIRQAILQSVNGIAAGLQNVG
jgi:phosphoenolpyruvate carboxylase